MICAIGRGAWKVAGPLLLAATPLVFACQAKVGAETTSIQVEKTVLVAPAGGGADLSFDASKGQNVRITMTSPASVQPYGHLDMPDGTAEYLPKNETSKPGFNTGEWVVKQSGKYKLTVFDGNNTGGSVYVKVEIK